MEDNRNSNTSTGRNRRRTTLVLLLTVGTLTVAGVAGTVLWGRGDAASTHPALSRPQSQAADPASAGNTQPTGVGATSGQQPSGNPGNPGQPGKLPPANQVPAPRLPQPTLPPLVFKHP